jgi:hypothetical protein
MAEAANALAEGLGMNLLLLSLFAPVQGTQEPSAAPPTIAELTVTIQSLRAELVNAYCQIINKDKLLDDLELSYGREQCPEPSCDTNPQGENEHG